MTVSDSPLLFSGLARVHRHVIDGFVAAGHDVLPCCWHGYDAETLQRARMGEKLPELFYNSNGVQLQLACMPKRRANMDEVRAMYDAITMYKPDIVFTIGDYFDFYYIQPLKIKLDFSFKWVPYLTVDTVNIESKMKSIFKYADAVAVPSVFGADVLQQYCENPVQVVPYGTDNVFKRFDDVTRDRLRTERNLGDCVRFVTVAQNTWRKNIPAIMLAAQRIALSFNEVTGKQMKFYIHTNLNASNRQEASIFDLEGIAEKLGVASYFEFSKNSVSVFDAPPDSVLADEYNASDFFVTATHHEGYGLPLVEGMACGLPLIASNASVMTEHLGATEGHAGLASRGWAVKNRVEICPPDHINNMIVVEDLAMALLQAGRATETEKSVLREKCMAYAKERTWEGMKRDLCNIVSGMDGPAHIPVEVVC
jgi:glycosyltransferase involved in cell wall biosynthesis